MDLTAESSQLTSSWLYTTVQVGAAMCVNSLIEGRTSVAFLLLSK